MMERSDAINRAQRALKALGEHPRSSQQELGHAREHLNACYSHGESDQVWDSVTKVEALAERRCGARSAEEQRTDPAGAADLEEPATATCGRRAEDLALRPAPVGECRGAGKLGGLLAGHLDEMALRRARSSKWRSDASGVVFAVPHAIESAAVRPTC
jgi:hypothetical protein